MELIGGSGDRYANPNHIPKRKAASGAGRGLGRDVVEGRLMPYSFMRNVNKDRPFLVLLPHDFDT